MPLGNQLGKFRIMQEFTIWIQKQNRNQLGNYRIQCNVIINTHMDWIQKHLPRLHMSAPQS